MSSAPTLGEVSAMGGLTQAALAGTGTPTAKRDLSTLFLAAAILAAVFFFLKKRG